MLRRYAPELVVGVLLAAWSVVSLLQIVAHGSPGDVLTGADGPYAGDQLQYLAWIREAGDGGLAGNGFDPVAGADVFVHPMFTLSGLLWRAGLSLQAALLVWKPVVVVVLCAGSALYVRHHLAGTGARLAALVLALFSASPLLAVSHFSDVLGARAGAGISSAAAASQTAVHLWGYVATAMAVGLMPVFLLLLERTMDRGRRGDVIAAAAVGLLVSWLHPWQGETLALVALGAVAWRRPRGPALVRAGLVVAALGLPLVAYFLLGRLDDGWRLAYTFNLIPGPPWWATALALVHLAVLAALGAWAHRRETDTRFLLLLLWPPAALVVLATSPTIPAHALTGIALPLAVLAVLGWRAVWPHAPRLVAAAAVALATLPALAASVDRNAELVRAAPQPHLLRAGERDALAYIDAARRPGPVLASETIGVAVPPFSGRKVLNGHPGWTVDYLPRQLQATALFDGTVRGAEAQRLIAASGAAFLLADCTDPTDLTATVPDAGLRARRFGCATVYEVVQPSSSPPIGR